MGRLRFEHVAGRYYVHPSIDVTQEPVFPGDVAEFDITHWDVCADAEQDARGNWTYQWIKSYDTEHAARAAARLLAKAEAA